jgi:DNA helicase-2/ATP-dependent DNA helicase PcrA
MILAGAGTGKTTTLIHRIIHLITQEKLPPESILALTFSEKAAAELRQRIEEDAQHHGQAGWGETLTATTFHSFCYQTAVEFLPEFRSRRLMNDGDILFLLREHYGELDELQSETFRREPARAILAFKSFFDRLRDELIQPDDFPPLMERAHSRLADQADEGWEELFHQLRDQCRVFPRYQQWKTDENLIDYGDMVYECWQLLDSDTEALATLQQRYHAIIVDEFQDNNYALNMIIARLAQRHHSVTVVGDDDQCIYSFRGASAYNIRDFRDRYSAVSGYGEIILDHNHRSLQPILDLANEVIRPNTGRQNKNLVAVKAAPKAPRPRLLVGSTATQIAAIAERIREQVDSSTYSLDDMAVLVRTHGHAGMVVSGLAARDIPSRHVHVQFFQLPAIRTVLAWCALIAGTPQAPMALYRLLGTYFGPVSRADLDHLLDQIHNGIDADPSSEDDKPRAPFRDSAEFIAAIRSLRGKSKESDAALMVWRILVTSGLYRTHFRAGYLEDQVAMANLTRFLELAREFTTRQEDIGLSRFTRYMEVLQDANAVEARIPLEEPTDAVQVITPWCSCRFCRAPASPSTIGLPMLWILPPPTGTPGSSTAPWRANPPIWKRNGACST